MSPFHRVLVVKSRVMISFGQDVWPTPPLGSCSLRIHRCRVLHHPRDRDHKSEWLYIFFSRTGPREGHGIRRSVGSLHSTPLRASLCRLFTSFLFPLSFIYSLSHLSRRQFGSQLWRELSYFTLHNSGYWSFFFSEISAVHTERQGPRRLRLELISCFY